MDGTYRPRRRRVSEREERARDERARGGVREARRERATISVHEIDGVIVATVFVLLLIGIIMVFSSSYYVAIRTGRGMFHYVFNQMRAVILGIVAMLIMANVNYRALGKFTPIMYLISVPLLVYTGLFGRLAGGARRWIDIPIFGSFQTVEFVKLALVLFMAYFITIRYKKNKFQGWAGIIIGGVLTLVPAAFAWHFTSSLSGAITLAAIGFGMIFIASPYFWRFVFMFVGAVSGMVAFLTLDGGYQGQRFASWLDPWSDPLHTGFQVIQGLYAVASGGLFGLGLGNSRQKLMYMVEPHNDFIFAIIAEELGFFGAGIIILLFCVLIYRGVRVALNAPDLLGTLIATGIIIMITVQVIINIGVVTGTLPNTGVPMPFISYGGTAILFLMALVGILLNISRYSRSKT